MKITLHRGSCQDGLYPLEPSLSQGSANKQAFGAELPSTYKWHSRLGHPSLPIMERIISSNRLSVSIQHSICDSCQMANSHQLPYPKSNSISFAPLELIFFDVWGPLQLSLADIHTMLAS
jgi:hypothetical protein